ncbi:MULTISPECIES: hypothetical protein [Pseudomonas]|nr:MULTISPECIES: hypothetical protein [Pseudomonas]
MEKNSTAAVPSPGHSLYNKKHPNLTAFTPVRGHRAAGGEA